MHEGRGGSRHTDTFLGWLQDFWASLMFKANFFLVGDFLGPLEPFSYPSWDAGTTFFFLVATPCPLTVAPATYLTSVHSRQSLMVLITPPHGHFRTFFLCNLCQMHRTYSSLALFPMWIEADLTSNLTYERTSSHLPWPIRYSGEKWVQSFSKASQEGNTTNT